MKAWHIALKDNLIRFRDRNGLLLMLAAPLKVVIGGLPEALRALLDIDSKRN